MVYKSNLTVLLILLPFLIFSQTLKSPQEYFGFPMGADKKLINWSQIVEYFHLLDQASDNIKVVELGQTTLKRPFIMAYISSAVNLNQLEHYKTIQKKLAYPYGVSEAVAKELITEGKLVMLLSMNIHSTEIAASQESVELAYELATRRDETVKKIRDNVILLMIPSLNPDGQDLISNWYNHHVGTKYEGSRLPILYHHYAGHDNNRDWFMFNLKESQLVAPVLYQQWFPEIVYDQHQMGSRGPRIFLPPYKDPINPNVPSLLLSEVNMLGKYVTSELTEDGFTGIINGMLFNSYFEGTMSKTPLWHNMIGILSELASVRIATPLYFPRGSLGKYGAEIQRYSRGVEFLNPWPGGWWRLRDIVEYEKAAAYSMLGFAVKFKEKIKKNFYTLNKQNIEQGDRKAPYQVVIPLNQYDPSSAELMLERLRLGGVQIYKADKPIIYDGKQYAKGSYIIPLAQPARSYIKDLFEIQKYPNLSDYPDGPPSRPYDFTGWTLPLQMGVKAFFTDEQIRVEMREVQKFSFDTLAEKVEQSNYYAIEARYNNAFTLINDLLKNNINVFCSKEEFADGSITRDSFIIQDKQGLSEKLTVLSLRYHVPVYGVQSVDTQNMQRIHRPKTAIYQPWGGNIDEGWTRLVLDNFHFDYTVLRNKAIKTGNISSKYDVIILPSMSVNQLVEAKREKSPEPFIGSAEMPEKYRGGIGKEGVKNLKSFILNGGTLITLGSSCDFAIDKLRVPAENVVKAKSRKEYFSPGSLVEIHLNKEHPITFGMPEKTAVRFTTSPAFRLLSHIQPSKAVGYFGEDNPLLSGWLIGDELLAGKTVLAEIPTEKGRVILFGFRVQSRSQTYGTFKLLFNAIYRATMDK